MSLYADLVCVECQVALWLGKTIFDDAGSPRYFKIGNEEDPPNSSRAELNRAVWKMLAEHAGHGLRVIVEGGPDENLLDHDALVEIGGDTVRDLSFEEYLRGWPG